ncbi:MAG: glycoside hydrolase family 3 C-terminal domain-containing protein [Clostridia bacterium]|nr:glycoside hydrolase family 3 C-terminal domain-containing protein [Clostridia bacterium]
MKHPEIVSQLTLEEKAALCSGTDMWHFKGIERLGVPAVTVSDGPHGLRKQTKKNMTVSQSVDATCFPLATSTASSWDVELVEELGRTLGEEAVAESVDVVLGPGVNIKRNPLCGRNFEYFSEDPLLAGKMAAGLINGIQSTGAKACIKHFAANNQEYNRMSISSEVDERTLREIYLRAFEIAIKESKPATVMCSYNKINGVYASEDDRLLNKILRDEWGFDGLVMSDWGAVNDRVMGVAAGLDVEMPSSGGMNNRKLVKAVKEGRLDEKVLDVAADRVIDLALSQVPAKDGYDIAEHDAISARIAEKCAVLLKNDSLLPFSKDEKVLIIGQLAVKPRYQGAGSSFINAHKVTSLIDALQEEGIRYAYESGYDIRGKANSEKLINEACELAAKYDKVVIMAGLTPKYEAEGFDRSSINLPPEQDELIKRVSEINHNTAVVLSAGSVVAMPWIDSVAAVLNMGLSGQASGRACMRLMYGMCNPCGKTAETYPISYDDIPSAKYFPGKRYTVEYREGLYVGYRYFSTSSTPVLFPFGHGLSYTRYEYSDIKIDKSSIKEGEDIEVSFKVSNVGDRDGEEISQVYISADGSPVYRPYIELKGFAKTAIKAGESAIVTIKLPAKSFEYYNTVDNAWRTHSGKFVIRVGGGSNSLPLSAEVEMQAKEYPLPECGDWYKAPNSDAISDEDFTKLLSRPITEEPSIPTKGNFTADDSIGDMAETCRLARFVLKMAKRFIRLGMHAEKDDPNYLMIYEVMKTSPIRALSYSSQGMLNEKMAQGLLMMMNGHKFKGLCKIIGNIGKK